MVRAVLPIAVVALAACVPPIPDRPPSMPEVTLGPEAPTTADELVVTLETGSESYTGRDITYTVTWLADGEVVQTVADAFSDGDSEILQAENTTKGERWTAEVVANDGGEDSLAGRSGRKIRNTVPVLGAAAVSPAEAYETSVLSCVAEGWADPDDDPESYSVSWSVDEVEVATNETLDGSSFDKDQQVHCTLTPMDDEEAGAPVESVRITILNTAPQATSASLSTTGPTEADTLSVTVEGAVDDDGDPVSYLYSWFVDGSLAAQTETINGDLFSKGQAVYVEVTPTDGGTDAGTVLTSDTATVVNTLPTLFSVTLTPDPVASDGILDCLAISNSDADGDSVQASYEWYVDGHLNLSEWGNQLGPTHFSEGDSVECVVTPDDNEDSGPSMTSNTVFVNNRPVVTGVAISPDPATSSTTDFTCTYATATDADGETPVLSFGWMVNGSDAGNYSATLTRTMERDDVLVCLVVIVDATEPGDTVLSPALTILNSPPTVTSVDLVPTHPTTNQVLTATPASTDPDVDTVTYEYEWFVDNVSLGTTSNATLDGTTSFEVGQTVEVYADPHDGTEWGWGGYSSSVTVANSLPTAPGISITPSSPTTDDDLVCSVDTVSTDDDTSQTLTYYYDWRVDGDYFLGSAWNAADGLSTWITADDTDEGETWECMVTAWDGVELGDSVTVSVELPQDVYDLDCSDMDIAAYDGITYSFCTEELSREDASARCDDAGMKLATIPSQSVNDWLVTQFTQQAYTGSADCDRRWIGATWDGGNWVWEDGSIAAYNSFDTNYQTSAEAQSRGNLSLLGAGCTSPYAQAGLWYAPPSHAVAGFICDNEVDHFDNDDDGYSEDDGDCDDTDGDIHPFAGDTYNDGEDSDCDGLDCEAEWLDDAYFAWCTEHFPQQDWATALSTCQAAGYDSLATIQSEDENDLITALGETAAQGAAFTSWLGLTDENQEGVYEWETGADLNYTNWLGGTPPSGGSSENCGAMYIKTSNLSQHSYWIDDDCLMEKATYVCEYRDLDPDDDDDGYPSSEDCDDTNATLFPYDSDNDGVEDACGWKQVEGGNYNTCAIDSTDSIQCWGMDETSFYQSTPPAGTFSQLSVALHHGCAIDTSGGVQCWGVQNTSENYGQVTGVPTSGVFTAMTTGERHSCAIGSTGGVTCWGAGAGEVGGSCFGSTGAHGSGFDYDCGQSTPPSGAFLAVSAGRYHTCGIVDANSSIACWGNDDESQVSGAPTTGVFTSISSGAKHTCAKDSSDLLHCWGQNVNNQATPPAGTFEQVQSGTTHTCGIDSAGEIQCWGWEGHDALLFPSGTFSLLGIGGNHGCAVDSSGELQCWGRDDWGQATVP